MTISQSINQTVSERLTDLVSQDCVSESVTVSHSVN